MTKLTDTPWQVQGAAPSPPYGHAEALNLLMSIRAALDGALEKQADSDPVAAAALQALRAGMSMDRLLQQLIPILMEERKHLALMARRALESFGLKFGP